MYHRQKERQKKTLCCGERAVSHDSSYGCLERGMGSSFPPGTNKVYPLVLSEFIMISLHIISAFGSWSPSLPVSHSLQLGLHHPWVFSGPV